MILCLGTTPAIQRVMIFDRMTINQVNRAVEVDESVAGKSVNVARVLATLGEPMLAIGFAGGDRGEFARREMDRFGVRHDFVSTTARTRLCTTVINRADHTQTELVEEAGPVTGEEWQALRAKLEANLPHAKMLILSGSLPKGAPADFYADCMRLAKARNIPILLDAAGEPLLKAVPLGPLLVKPNRAELASTVKMPVDSDQAICQAARALLAQGPEWVVVTAGPQATLVANRENFWRIQVPRVPAVNPIGSGDSFTAGIAAGLMRGQSMVEACKLGAACGTANVLTLHAAEVHLEDVRKLLPQIQVERMG